MQPSAMAIVASHVDMRAWMASRGQPPLLFHPPHDVCHCGQPWSCRHWSIYRRVLTYTSLSCLVLSRLISFSYYPVGSHPATACTRAAIPGVDTVGNVLAAAERVGLSVHLGLAFAESSRIPPWMNSTEYFRTYAGLNWEVRLPSLFSHCLSLCCCRCRVRTHPFSFDFVLTVRRISFIVHCPANPHHACLCLCEGHSCC